LTRNLTISLKNSMLFFASTPRQNGRCFAARNARRLKKSLWVAPAPPPTMGGWVPNGSNCRLQLAVDFYPPPTTRTVVRLELADEELYDSIT
jgi:hypothetical protein